MDRSSGGSPSLGRPRAAACSNAKFGATEITPPVSPGFARHLAHPADGPTHERGRRHEGEVLADHRRQHDGDQAHVVEERQPGDAPVALVTLEGLDHLHHVGGQVQVGDLHAGGDAGRTRRVLQVGDGLAVDLDGLPGRADVVRHRVDGDDTRALLGRPAAEELAHTFGGVGSRQNRRRVAVVEDGVQTADVARLVRVEQRHRDAAGVQGAEERDEVVEVLRAQDGDPVTGLGHLLQAGADGAVARAELGPVQIALDTLAFGREVQESVGELVSTHLRPSLDVTDQVAVVRKPDLSVLDEWVMEPHHTLLSKPHSGRRSLSVGRAIPKPRRSYRGFGRSPCRVSRCSPLLVFS